MSTPSTTETKTTKKRRTLQEQLEANASERKAIESALSAKTKGTLERLAKESQAAALAASGKPYAAQIGQAATLLSTAANSIKVEQ